MSALYDAIARGDAGAVQKILDADPTLALTRDASGSSPLVFAMYRGHPELVPVIREWCGDLDVFEAAATGDLRACDKALSAEPSLARAWSQDGFTPLHLACFFGHVEVAALLLVNRADPNAPARNAMKVTPLSSAVAHRDAAVSATVVRRLLEAGADPNVAQQGGWTPLHQAAFHGNHAIVDALIARGADARARSDDGHTPGDMARKGGHDAIAELLDG